MIDKKVLIADFKDDNNNYWPCPTCSKGYLVLEKDTLTSSETADSKKSHNHYAWEHEWINLVYSCMFKCSNKNCEEKVASIGSGYVEMEIEPDKNGYPERVYTEYFHPLYFSLPLKIINIPDKVPEDIKKQLYKSFELFFSSPASTINNMRSVIELILTHLKVPKTTLDKKRKKRVRLNLHNRIEKLDSKHDEIKELLLAIKWVGNDGSHTGKDITKNDVLEIYEILELALSELFENKSKEIRQRAKQINKDKGLK